MTGKLCCRYKVNIFCSRTKGETLTKKQRAVSRDVQISRCQLVPVANANLHVWYSFFGFRQHKNPHDQATIREMTAVGSLGCSSCPSNWPFKQGGHSKLWPSGSCHTTEKHIMNASPSLRRSFMAKDRMSTTYCSLLRAIKY